MTRQHEPDELITDDQLIAWLVSGANFIKTNISWIPGTPVQQLEIAERADRMQAAAVRAVSERAELRKQVHELELEVESLRPRSPETAPRDGRAFLAEVRFGVGWTERCAVQRVAVTLADGTRREHWHAATFTGVQAVPEDGILRWWDMPIWEDDAR